MAPPAQQLAVTVAITRRADRSRTAEMTAWVRAGSTLAEDFPGFLGTGWVRPQEDSDEWHMLYRFADAQALHDWEESPQRAWWLSSAEGFVEHTRTERRTGIEGWFDPPQEQEVQAAAGAPAPPPRWKQAVTIWLGFFPLSLLAAVTLGHLLADVNVVLRTLVTTLCLTPLMTYLVLPRVTKALQPWLRR
ncbi:antibiotic biosynthesis monooxygenase [Micromonosporaceae bacterium Da 78-11]